MFFGTALKPYIDRLTDCLSLTKTVHIPCLSSRLHSVLVSHNCAEDECPTLACSSGTLSEVSFHLTWQQLSSKSRSTSLSSHASAQSEVSLALAWQTLLGSCPNSSGQLPELFWAAAHTYCSLLLNPTLVQQRTCMQQASEGTSTRV